MQVLAAIF